MRWLSSAIYSLRALFSKRKLDAQLSEEMRTHVEMATEANVAKGMPPDEARYTALREFGNVVNVQERTRDERGWVWLEQIGKDTGFAVRSLRRARGFTVAVWATLTVGIGVASVIVGITTPTILSPPYPEGGQFYFIGYKDKQNSFTPHRTALHFQAYLEQTDAFSAYAAVKWEKANVMVAGQPVIADLLSVSIDSFATLGLRPSLGRGFMPNEHKDGADQVVILAGHFWRQHFNGDPGILGRTVSIGSQICTVIGVFDPNRSFPTAFAGDVYRPLVLKSDPAVPFGGHLNIIGRLRPGVSVEQAQAQLTAVKLPEVPPWAAAYFAEQETVLKKPADLSREETQWVMLAAAGLLYGMACLNAMNLMVVRLLARRHEISIRLSLGGTRWQIARLLLLEAIGLVTLAGGTVLFVARWVFPVIFATVSRNEALQYASYWNWHTANCILGLSVVAWLGLVFAPMWRLFRADPGQGLKEGGRALGAGRQLGRLRAVLVMLQTALAVILLAGAGLMVRSFEKIRQVDLGFDPTGLVKVNVTFPTGFEPAPQARLQLFARLAERLATLPGVKNVSAGQDAVLVGTFWGTAQLQMADGSYRAVAGNFVAANFLATAGLTLKSGRWLTDRAVYEVVISESMARARFGEEDPVGKSIRLLVSGNYEIPVVGVVKDVRETLRSGPGMRFYTPAALFPPNVSTLLLKLKQDPNKAFAGQVRRVIYELEPKAIVETVSSIHEIEGDIMWAERNALGILEGLSAIALGVAAVGIFSVIAFTVSTRTQEFGVRMALGAQPGNLHQLVIKDGLALVAFGIGLGTASAIGLTQFMRSLLFETTPNDPMVYVGVAGALLASTILACWLPARRAAKVDPVVALRAE